MGDATFDFDGETAIVTGGVPASGGRRPSLSAMRALPSSSPTSAKSRRTSTPRWRPTN